jgi:hypothetical protein
VNDIKSKCKAFAALALESLSYALVITPAWNPVFIAPDENDSFCASCLFAVNVVILFVSRFF